jgi:hypothetical protein
VFVKLSSIDSGVDFFKPSAEAYMSRSQKWCPHLDGVEKKETSLDS